MHGCPGEGDRINSFALVSYIPGRLGKFLDQLRRDLVPGCFARSHVTVLPPRALPTGAAASVQIPGGVQDVPAFELKIGEVAVFAATSVIYLELGAGRSELEMLHERLNSNALHAQEPFAYHPHITLAQDLKPEQVADLAQRARRRWAEFSGARSYTVDCFTFVQNTATNQWIDLEEFGLRDGLLAAIER